MYQITDEGLIFSEPIPTKMAPGIIRQFLYYGSLDVIKNLDYDTQIRSLGKDVISMYIWMCLRLDVVLKETVIRKIILDGNAVIVRQVIRYLDNPYTFRDLRTGPNPHYNLEDVFSHMSDALHIKLWKMAFRSDYLMTLAKYMPLSSLPLAIGLKSGKWDKKEWLNLVERRIRDHK